MSLKTMINKKSFTLIELLVVIAIIGVLSSIIFVSVNSAVKKARDIRRIANLKMICTALEAYYIEYGHYPNKGCSHTGESVNEHYGKYRDDPNSDPYGDRIFDVLQDDLAPDIVKPYVPNDPSADYPSNEWSYFYDNYYDSTAPENTPETSECTDQAFQLLGYLEVGNAPFGWEPAWGTYEGKGWWRACKAFP